MKLNPTWWCDKNDDGAPVLRVSCMVPGGIEWRSQYVMRKLFPPLFAVHVAVEILTYELGFMYGTELTGGDA